VNPLVIAAMLAASPQGPAKARAPSFAILDFTVPQAQQGLARALTSVVASRIDERGGRVITRADMKAMLTFEKERQTAGCAESDCMADLAGALGVKYVVNGELEQVGNTWVLTLSLFEGAVVRRFSDRVATNDDQALFSSAEKGAEVLAGHAGLAPPERSQHSGHIALKLGGSLQVGRINLEYDYYVRPWLQILLQGSMFISKAGFSAVPAGVGAKYTFRAEQELRPYAGGLVGVSIVGKSLRPNLTGLTGLAYIPWKHFGGALEASLDSSSIGGTDAGTVALAPALSLALLGLW
jgi:hypothetical protein